MGKKNGGKIYYDWDKTLSFDAPITMIISHRGIGKTYGIRRQFIRDYLKTGKKFVHISRYDKRLELVEPDYFLKVGREQFPDYEFKTQKHRAYIREKTGDKKKQKPWEHFGFFVSLTDFQAFKEATFTDVKRILLDEAVIDKDDRFHNYLPNEVNLVANILDSATRERKGDGTDPRLYLLGNATDINCPYLQFAGVYRNLPEGYSWWRGKTMLIHYDKNEAYAESKLDTLAGMMATGKAAEANINNEFSQADEALFQKKTSDAQYLFGIHDDDIKLGVWVDTYSGRYYVNNKTPVRQATYALSMDGAPNYVVLPKINPYTKALYSAHLMGYVRYQTAEDYSNARLIFEILGYNIK